MGSRLGMFLASVCLVVSTVAEAGEVLDRARARGSLIAAAVPEALPQAAVDSAGKLRGFDIEVDSLTADPFTIANPNVLEKNRCVTYDSSRGLLLPLDFPAAP